MMVIWLGDNEDDIDENEEVDFEKTFEPHFVGWTCPICKSKLYDKEKGSAFFWCYKCDVYYFKNEIREGKTDFGKDEW